MKTWVRKTLSIGVLAAGALLFGPGVAHADARQDSGILNGTQQYAPIRLVGNSAAVLGGASSHALADNRVESAQGGWFGQSNGDNSGFLNGTQFGAPISLPLNVCGNSLGLLGQASSFASCESDVVGGGDGFGGDDMFFDGEPGHGHGHRHGHGLQGNLAGHGHKGHKGHKGHGDQDPGYLSGNGTMPAMNDNGYGGTAPTANDNGHGAKPATNDNGYGGTQPTANDNGHGAKPATNHNGHGTKPATSLAGYPKGDDNGNKDDSNGYKGRKSVTEASPVSS